MMFDVFATTAAWAEARPDLSLWASREVDSTNAYAKDDCSIETQPSLLRPTLYLARHQSAGRGRGTNIWTEPESGAWLASFAFAVERVPQPIFSALAGLALYESLSATWPSVAFNVKAPNDLFVGARKVAGILIETVDTGQARRTVVGIGMNILESPSGLAATATSLQEHLSQPISGGEWRSFLSVWYENLKAAVAAGQRAQLSAEAAARLCLALNLHPLLKEPILTVDELGQLHSASRILRWQEL